MSNLVLDGVNANPVSYIGLSKFETEWLKNVKYLHGLKKTVEKTEQKINQSRKKVITANLVQTFKLTTYNNESCIKFADIKHMFKSSLITRLTKSVITMCNKTGKVINHFNSVTKTKYITLTWLLEVLNSDFANTYFVKSAIQQLTT